MELTPEEISALPIASMKEWEAFVVKEGFYTAPEFLVEKFILKNLKRPPSHSAIHAKRIFHPSTIIVEEEEE
jgi:hypothetical protein